MGENAAGKPPTRRVRVVPESKGRGGNGAASAAIATPVAPAEKGRDPRADVNVAAMAKLRELQAEAASAVAAARLAPSSGSTQARQLPGRAGSGAASAPDEVASDREAGLLAMLRIEGEAREAPTLIDLLTLIANAPRRLTRARQIFVVRRIAGSFHTVAVSALPAVDRTAPLIRLVEHALTRLSSEGVSERTSDFRISAYAQPGDETAMGYPMQEALWVPFLDREGEAFAGMLLTRESPWQEADLVIAKRLGGAFQHALQAIDGRRPLWRRFHPSARMKLAVLAVLLGSGFLPVSLTTLAPAQVVAADPFIVAASIDGVIDEIPVEPNALVGEGALLVKLDDTTLRNKYELAEREVLVAEARLRTTTQLAFDDERGRHDLAVARADLVLKTAEREFARDLLAKAEVRAPRAGLVLLSDKKELIGKPVAVGERILEIADPARVELRLDVPVADAIILKDGAPVKVLLDSDPLSAIKGEITHSDYQARPSDAQVLSFRALAALRGADAPPRLGARGSAQIHGDRVPLAFFLLRRPFAKLRQWTGL